MDCGAGAQEGSVCRAAPSRAFVIPFPILFPSQSIQFMLNSKVPGSIFTAVTSAMGQEAWRVDFLRVNQENWKQTNAG